MKRLNKKVRNIVIVVIIGMVLEGLFIGYEGWTKKVQERTYERAEEELKMKNYSAAIEDYYYLGDYKDSSQKLDLARKYEKYSNALKLYKEGNLSEAKVEFEELDDFEDSKNYALLCSLDDYNRLQEEMYTEALAAMDSGNYVEARNLLSKIENYKDSKKYLIECEKYIWRECLANKVSAGSVASIGIGQDKLLATGIFRNGQDKLDIEGLTSVSTNLYYTIGVYDDGTAVVAGSIDWYNDIEKRKLSNVIEGVAAHDYVAFLFDNGTVWGEGYDSIDIYGESMDFSDWSDVIDIDAGYHLIAGVSKDGSIYVAGRNASSIKTEIDKNKNKWRDVYKIAVGGGSSADDGFVIGLRKDNRVVVAGNCDEGVIDAETWSDIIDISAGDYHVLGLTTDGKVKGALNINNETNNYGGKRCCDFSEWDNLKISSIEAGNCTTIIVTEDGKVYTRGYDHQRQIPKDKAWIVATKSDYSFLEYIKNSQ